MGAVGNVSGGCLSHSRIMGEVRCQPLMNIHQLYNYSVRRTNVRPDPHCVYSNRGVGIIGETT